MEDSAIERSIANTHIVISEKDLATCTKVLRQLHETHEATGDCEEVERLVAALYKRIRKQHRKRSEIQRELHDRDLVARTGRVRSSLSIRDPVTAGRTHHPTRRYPATLPSITRSAPAQDPVTSADSAIDSSITSIICFARRVRSSTSPNVSSARTFPAV